MNGGWRVRTQQLHTYLGNTTRVIYHSVHITRAVGVLVLAKVGVFEFVGLGKIIPKEKEKLIEALAHLELELAVTERGRHIRKWGC